MSIKIAGQFRVMEAIEQNPGITVSLLAEVSRENINNVRKWVLRHEYNGIVKTDRSQMANRYTVTEGWREKLEAYESKFNAKAREQGKKSRQFQLENKTLEALLQRAMAMRPDVKTTWRTEVMA